MTEPHIPAQRQPASTVEVDGPPPGLWDRMRADPQYAPEQLALEAVERIGPEAQAWAVKMRERRPDAHPAAFASEVIVRFTRHARLSGAISGVAGLPGAVLDMGVLVWTQCRMVLYIAAVYGIDPTHPDRATDLLVLQRVHKATEAARLALGVATGRERLGDAVGTFSRSATGKASKSRAFGALAMKLAQMAGMRAVKRVLAKVLPFASVIFGSWANSSATKELARRTTAYYEGISPLIKRPGQVTT
ncbi:uncharacterized protein (DUF697 family) [Allocatelliglobosispora scoriae]|uniref:Uncharacterized protein (DUF697 family) n=1 Tax=Allocatelliglobosispora scoriae TaxID=643052 RepID=A0A841C0D1_9ACTN|nr:EcsC family protein [Allocatelliglobosispora scoriae]MBB5873385.1 uncharacterized protein (DUF697 family) [Allocatelliglobosispora scoriae]